jgi:hypothetical protein
MEGRMGCGDFWRVCRIDPAKTGFCDGKAYIAITCLGFDFAKS